MSDGGGRWTRGVFLLQGEDTLVRMVEQPYEAESLRQVLLAAHPYLLAGDQIDQANPRRWLLIERGVGVPAAAGAADLWAVDQLFLDQDATPTSVEVKRHRHPGAPGRRGPDARLYSQCERVLTS